MDPAQPYCLFLAKSCPYAHRIEIVRNLRGLNNIRCYYADPKFVFSGWNMDYDYQGNNPAKIFNVKTAMDIYRISDPNFTGRATLPILFDSIKNKIVSNESMQIIQMMAPNLTPIHLAGQINTFIEEFSKEICTGIYKAGHAKNAEEKTTLTERVFNYLTKFDSMISVYIFDELTMADIIAYPHLMRFDCIYHGLYKLDRCHLHEYPNICKYLSMLNSSTIFRSTIDVNEMKSGGYLSENNLPCNPDKLIPDDNGGMEHYY